MANPLINSGDAVLVVYINTRVHSNVSLADIVLGVLI